jgi:RHS repeat-associated protein
VVSSWVQDKGHRWIAALVVACLTVALVSALPAAPAKAAQAKTAVVAAPEVVPEAAPAPLLAAGTPGAGPISAVTHSTVDVEGGGYELVLTVSLSRPLAAGEYVVLYEKGRPTSDQRIGVQGSYSPWCGTGAASCTHAQTTPRTTKPVYIAVVTTGERTELYADLVESAKVGELEYSGAPAWSVSLTRDMTATDRIRLTATSNYLPGKVSGQMAIFEKDYWTHMNVAYLAFTSGASVTGEGGPHAYEGRYIAVVSHDSSVGNHYGDLPESNLMAQSAEFVAPPWSLQFDGTTARTNYDLSSAGAWLEFFDLGSSGPVGYTNWCSAGTVCTVSGTPRDHVLATIGSISNWPLPNPTYLSSQVWGGPSAAEQGGAPSTLEPCTTCHVGQPVNTATGTFWHSFIDVSVPGRGPGLELSRTYSSSAAAAAGMFGFGWGSSYEARLVPARDGNGSVTSMTLVDRNNAHAVFTKVDNGYWAPARVQARLAGRQDGSLVLTDTRARTTYTFDAQGVLQKVTDRNGHSTTLTYGSGKLATVTDAAGRSLTYTWTADRVTSVSDPMGRTWTYAYHPDGTLASATDPLGRATAFTYDAATHLLRTMTFPGGGTVSNEYVSGRISKQTDTDGLVTTYDYSGDPTTDAGSTTTVTGRHSTTKHVYRFMNLQSVTRNVGTAAEATTSKVYDPVTMRVIQETDPMGKVRSFEYDHYGNQTKRTDPPVGGAPGKVWTATYNPDGTIATSTLPTGKSSSWAYDGKGNVTGHTDPNAKTTIYAYGDPAHPGDVTAVTDPGNRVTTFTYDTAGNVASQSLYPTAGVTLTSAASYNANGEQICAVTPAKHADGLRCPASFTSPPAGVTSRVLDAAGQVTSVTDPAGRTRSMEYDADGNQTKTTGPGTTATGGVTTRTYDTSGRVKTSTTAAGTPEAVTTSYSYDIGHGTAPCTAAALSTIAKFCDTTTDPAGKVTTRYFSGLDQLVGLAEPGGRLTRTSYRLDGRVETVTRPDGRSSTAAYFDDGLLQSVTHSTGIPGKVSYTYRADGLRASMADATGTTSYSYDHAGYLTGLTRGSSTVGYTRDGSHRVTAITYPSGRVVTRGFDGAGRMTSVTDGAGRTTTFGYDANGNQTSTELPVGRSLTKTFDAADQLSAVTLTAPGTELAQLSWTRNDYDQVAAETGTGATPSSETYSYWATHRLKGTGPESFGYDPVANPTQLGAMTQTFDPSGNGQLIQATRAGESHSYTYDTNGNRTHETTTGGDDLALAATFDQTSKMISSEVSRTTELPGSFVPLSPCRLFDTRTTDPGPSGAVPGGATLAVQAGGKCDIPATGVAAVAVNLTSTGSTTNGYLVAHAAGGPVPASSNVNYTAGKTVATLAVVSLSTGGALAVKNFQASTATTHIIGDIAGYYLAGTPTGGNLYKPLTPARIMDTRNGIGGVTGPVGAGQPVNLQVTDAGGVPTTGVSAVVLNVTALGGTATSSYVTTYPEGTTRPTASTLNFNTGETVSNLAMATLGSTGKLALYNAAGTVHLLVDVVGYYTTGTTADGGYKPLATPTRALDTRYGTGAPQAKVGAGGEVALQVTGSAGVPATGVAAVVLNLTAVGGTATSYLTAYPDGTSRPITSNLNFTAGDTTANAAIVKVSPSGTIRLYNDAGQVDLIADITGYFTAPGGSNGTTTTTASYTYDGDGLRATKTPSTTVGTTTTTSTASYTYDLTGPVPLLLSDGTTDYIHGPDGRPIEHLGSATGANPAWYLTDQHGDTRALIDAAGAIAATYDYTAYGVPTRSSGTATTPLLYGGGHHDTDTGLIYLINRYYDPGTGTFTSIDPAVLVTGSPYGYVGGDPLNLTDPSGLCPFCAALLIGGLIGAGTDLAGQAVHNMLNGCEPFDNINWGQVAGAGLLGAATLGRGNALKGVKAANSGNRVFWSGGQPAKEAAEAFAKANGAKTLEMTTVGRALERLPYNRFTAGLWDAASAGFAATARGDANVFIGPSFRGAGSTFGRIEGPILRFKGNSILQRFEDVW